MGLRHAPHCWVGLTCIGLAIWIAPGSALGQEVGPYVPPGVVAPTPEAPAPEAPPPEGRGWIFTPRIGIDEILTDNVRQSTVGQQKDLISIISPGINVIGDTARFKVGLDFGPQLQRYVNASDQDRLAENLFGTGEAIIFPDLLFFDAAASISQQNITGGQGSTNQSLTPAGQRTQVIATSLGPTLRTDIGTIAQTELTYQYSRTSFTNNTSIAGSAGLSNTTQNEGRFVLGTGEDFGRLHSVLLVDAVRETGSGTASSQTEKLAELDNEYVVVRSVSIIGQGGYEDETFPNSALASIRGPIWAGGAAYHPNPDTEARLTYGRRDGGNDFEGKLRFAVTPTTKVSISYTQRVETTQQGILQGLGNAQLGPGGTVINPSTGLPTSVVNPNFPLRNDIFRLKSLQGGVINTLGRNTFTITGFRQQQISLTGFTPSETATGGAFQWTREMSPRLTGSMLAGYVGSSGTFGATTNVSIGLNYLFTNTLTGGIRYDFINGGGGVATSGVGGTSFTENALTLSLRKTF